MSEHWKSLNLNGAVPEEVLASIKGGTSALTGYLTIARKYLELARAAKFQIPTVPDALQLTIEAIADAVEGFLQLGKIHVLFVPIAKVFPTAEEYIPFSRSIVQTAYGDTFRETGSVFTTGANQAFAKLHKSSGGTGRFFQTFLTSLTDEGDPNRPQYFDANDAVGMTVFLTGAPTFIEIAEVAAGLNRIFRPQGNNDLTARTIPIPQGIRVKVVGAPRAARVGVRIEWDVPPPLFASPYFPGVSVEVKRYAIIRSRSPRMMNADSVLDLFATRNLTEGLNTEVFKVIAVGSGINSSYLDQDSDLDAKTTYYYAVAWEIEITERGTRKTLPFDRLSSVVKTRVKEAVPTHTSTPPDWWAYKSAMDVLPNFAAALRRFVEELRVLGDRANAPTKAFDLCFKLMADNFDQLLLRVTNLNTDFERLATILAQQLPDLYTTSMVAKGGNAFLASELAQRLTDTSDPGRPPYDGNQYVCGICLVAGGPRLPDIQPILDFFNLLFNSDPDAADPLLGVLTAIDSVITAEEAVVFGQDLKPVAPGTALDPLTGLPVPTGPSAGLTPDQIVIAEDGTVVPVDDPNNPEQGVSGLVDLAELC